MTLHDFLRLPHRFAWGGVGGDDCTTFCARWIECLTGADPAANFRGAYSTQEEAEAILAAAGGLVAFADRHLGLVRTDDPQPGDVGVIVAPSALDGEFKHIAAIRFGPLWATLSPAGVRARKADFVAAWRVPGCGHDILPTA